MPLVLVALAIVLEPMADNGSLQEAYVHGASTCSVDDQVKAMGAGGMSKSQVSRLCAEIDARVNAFLSRRWRALGPTCGSTRPI